MWKKKAVVTVLGLALSLGAAGSAFAAEAGPGASAGSASGSAVTQAADWKGEVAALKKQLEALRAEQKQLVAQMKKLHASNKAAYKGLTKEERKAVKPTLAELAKQIKERHDAIVSLRKEKTAEWAKAKAAKEAGDSAAGVAALERIVSLKEQIIAKQQEILTLQLQIQSALGGAAGA